MATLPPIKCGLFHFDLVDYHAILGVPIGASPESVRKQYLKITRLLFPDLRQLKSEQEKQLADQLLSKLINPSYETLFKDQVARKEHLIILERLSESLVGENDLKLRSRKGLEFQQEAKKGNLEALYKKYLAAVCQRQYNEINKSLKKIALISEFNIVYLKLKYADEHQNQTILQQPPQLQAKKNQVSQDTKTQKQDSKSTASEDKRAQWVEPYLRRGKQFIDKQDYSKAILELREALQLDPKSSQAHTLLGLTYVKQGQLGMARVHVNKALQLDPKNELALEGKKVLEKLTQDATDSKKSNNNRGLLGGLFGKNKNGQ